MDEGVTGQGLGARWRGGLQWGMEGKRAGWVGALAVNTCVFHLDQAGVERKSRFGAS